MEGREGPPPKDAISPVEKLKPQEFVDADGAKRQLFTFNKRGAPVGVVFYAKEDLPFSEDVLKEKEGFVLGGPPNFRDIGEWDSFLGDVQKASKTHHSPTAIHNFNRQKAVDSGEAVFFVENNSVSILDMAFILGLEGSDLRNERKAAAIDRRFGPMVKSIIDNAIAGTVVDDEGKITKRENQEGEALALQALLGDGDAQALLEKKRQVLEKRDFEKKERIDEWASKTVERLTKEGVRMPQHVIATHTTRYKPVITEEGIELQTSFDATGGKSLRGNIHFSTVGAVDSRLGGGGWDEMPYVISGDLKAIRDRNGNPRKIAEIDTYFTVSPGERLVVPNAHLTMPGWVPEGVLRENRGRVTIYKNKDLTARDVDAVLTDYYDKRYSQGLILEKVKDCFNSVLWSKKVNDGKADSRREGYIAFIEKLNPEKFLNDTRQQGIQEAVKEALVGYSQSEADDIVNLSKGMESVFVTAIRNGGFYSTTGSGEDSQESKALVLLAASWGTRGDTSRQAHFNDPEGLGLEAAVSYPVLREAKRARERLGSYDREERETPSDGTLRTPRFFYESFDIGYGANQKKVSLNSRAEIMEAVREDRGFLSEDPRTRRMHYLAGVI